ncbi:MAG: helicase-exonuclease AddAB subunit AddA [Faecousia sp.]
MAETLTPQQAQAVQNRGGKLLVSAAAGSGKTKVLVDRLLGYLTDPVHPANLDDFLIITYTKAAASELRGKIAAKLTERIAREPENKHLQKQLQRLYLTQISTVHGFCSAILREYAYRIDLAPDFRVADEAECMDLKNTVLKDLLDRAYEEQNSHFREFVDSQGVGRSDGAVPEIVLKVYDSARCHLNPQAWLDGCLENISLEGVTDAGQSLWGKFLMEDFFFWLDQELAVLRGSLARLKADDGVEKPIENIAGLISQLEFLRASTTWDQLHSRKEICFGTLRFSGKTYDPALAGQVKAVRQAVKDELEKRTRCFADDSDQVLSDLRRSGAAAQGLIELVRQFDDDYSRAKRSRRILDFGDLEHRTLDLLLGKSRTGITAAARELSARFREILVDEYQDSNGVQDAIFSALTEEKQNCFLVGDVKQSIYRFRLADPQIFLEKYASFAPAEQAKPGEGRKILLSHNFRSGAEVISGINDVFSHCMSPEVGGLYYTEAEALREGVPHVPLEDQATELYVLEVTDGDSYEKEAAFAAGRIRQMLESGTAVRQGDSLRPVTPEDIVILLRSPGTMAEPFRRALEAEGIRCALEGGANLMDTEEVSTLCALLQTVANPRQDIPLLTVLASPVFGFTADELAGLRAGSKKICIFEALLNSGQPKVQEFLDILSLLRRKARLEPLTALLQSCFLLTRLDSVYGAMPGGKAKKENLQTFYQMAVDFEKGNLRTLDQFLEHLETLRGSQVAADRSSAGCVTIMSIHKSKGLEFPVVFLCGLSHRFNASDVRQQVLCDKDLGLGLAVADNQNRLRYSSISKRAIAASIQRESVSEELRVLYVAMTRARDRLVMTCTMKNPEKKLRNLSDRLSAGGERLLCMEADCHGDWILTAAMQRLEAGELHALSGRPEKLYLSDYPWKIRLLQTESATEKASALAEEEVPFPAEAVEQLKKGLSFRYDHLPATQAPSKQTVTGRKGRTRDEEVQEDTPAQHRSQPWRKPTFREAPKGGTARGNAVHSAMQFIRYEACADLPSVEAELSRLVQAGYLTSEQGGMVNPKQIVAFFASDIGKKLRSGTPYIREFKFSILDAGENYGEGLEGEQVLLQGVVDCALLEKDGITVLDFKTDRVTPDTLPQAVRRYQLQLDTYAEALSRIYEMPIKEKYLYFFHLNQFVPV